MLIISLIFLSLVILLIFCLSKDTGENTVHARRHKAVIQQQKSPDIEQAALNQADAINVN
ncbi:hypothetical protein [Aliiglaciecola sp. LCG003]|uniref:hypothetical protein n=1 Tax=Aliiglaciecola sp. LCG003 TaxID=3053655 RepID=UPI0025724C2D|nr:hypothetical protein [Aliiglaciecola sp. LCG003]WJG08651.1 hypothetical protein QR722_15080 [Aliiglaciecola sp. LCG003]